MSKTEYLNLNLTPDVTDESFVQWRNSIDGEENSNMAIIDDKFGKVDSSIQDRYNGNESDELCLPKDKVDGVSVQTKFAVDSDAINYQIWGNSKQETRSGKNLIPYPYFYTTKTINGVVFTDNGDGTITVNGTATANTDYIVTEGSTYFLTSEYNYLSGCPTGGSITTYMLLAYTNIGGNLVDIGNGVSTFDTSKSSFGIRIRIISGTTVHNLVFKPQLEEGSTATPYEPYGAMPSPEFPSEIQSVGERTKNLFNLKEWYSNYINDMNGISYTNLDFREIYLKKILKGQFKENTRYTFSCIANINSENPTYGIMFRFIYTDGTSSYQILVGVKENVFINITSYTNKTIDYFDISYHSSTIKTTVDIKDVQLEENSTVTEYEPYGYKIPILTRGKNLLNFDSLPIFDRQEDGSYKSNRTITNINSVIPLNLPIENYILSLDIKCETNKNYRPIIHYKDGTYTDMYVISTGDYIHMEKVLKNKEIDYFNFSYNEVSSNVYIKNIQLEKGSISTDYEPYREENINIYLKEPLRKIGDYVDYIDFKRGVVVSDNYFIIGSNTSIITEYNKNVFLFYFNGIKGKSKDSPILCSHSKNPIHFSNINADRAAIIKSDFGFDETATVQNFKDYLQNQYDNGTPVTFMFTMNTPIEKQITLQPLHLQSGINNISLETTTQPSNLSIRYYQNVSDRINELIDAIITQI